MSIYKIGKFGIDFLELFFRNLWEILKISFVVLKVSFFVLLLFLVFFGEESVLFWISFLQIYAAACLALAFFITIIIIIFVPTKVIKKLSLRKISQSVFYHGLLTKWSLIRKNKEEFVRWVNANEFNDWFEEEYGE